MGRITSNRKIAEALVKTLQRLEADPSVDPNDPAFIHLKCTFLQRLMSLELDDAEARNSIHLVEAAEPEPADSDDAEDTAIA